MAGLNAGADSGVAPVRVLIVDDDALVRAGLSMILGGVPDVRVVGEATDGSEVPAAVEAYAPDVVLMDIRMPRVDGLTATETLRALPRPPEVLVLTTFDADDQVLRALRAGAAGFLLKDTPPAELLNAIRVVADGEALLAPSVTRRLIDDFTRRPGVTVAPTRSLDGVTPRERDVLALVGRGRSNREIAEDLCLSVGTVKTHVSRLLTKLDARDRAQLVIAAYQTGVMNA
jgi:DNA-binding NarL/FixJ family response regulator